MSDTSVKIGEVTLKNPVIAASGTFGFAREYADYFSLSQLGGISTKGLTLKERSGNNGIRVHETVGGIMNSIGLQNPGVDKFIEEELSFLSSQDTTIIANVGGSTVEEYILAVEKLNDTDIDIVELNISCPNVKEGGISFGTKSDIAYNVVKQVRKICKKPLMVKLSPSAEDIKDMAVKCVEAGADSLSLVNTFPALAIDIKKRKPIFDNITAGLSGPCIKPIALRMVYEVSKVVDVPVVGIGGISNYKDAIEFIIAGATAIQVGTANFVNPKACIEIIEGIEQYMKEEKINALKEMRGII
ncbi:dihydroorotate dehydrogenase [Petrotoga sp. 9PW.55.5.1]|uniref:dihydroorotate dehydrogenase n=1 Tax=Petrotoga sp. 9PW.55.5.1 TaxID=1308979 RepID=UPI000DD86A12|nr:dihydroorotate dehydrogenase [Petrotoga sp. 9PW.55.5.1]